MNIASVTTSNPTMFQKLYHHLEEIKANTGRQQANSERVEAWTEEISQQLKVFNDSVSSLATSVRSLNTSVSSLEKPRPHPRRLGAMPVAAFVLAGVGLILLGTLALYAYR